MTLRSVKRIDDALRYVTFENDTHLAFFSFSSSSVEPLKRSYLDLIGFLDDSSTVTEVFFPPVVPKKRTTNNYLPETARS